MSVDDDVDNSEKEEQQEGRILYLIHKFIKLPKNHIENLGLYPIQV